MLTVFSCFVLLQYPWFSENLEKDVELAQNVIGKARSMRADYNLTKQRADSKISENYIICDSVYRKVTVVGRLDFELGGAKSEYLKISHFSPHVQFFECTFVQN